MDKNRYYSLTNNNVAQKTEWIRLLNPNAIELLKAQTRRAQWDTGSLSTINADKVVIDDSKSTNRQSHISPVNIVTAGGRHGRTDGRIIAGRRGQGGRGFISQVNTRMDKADIDGDMYAYVMDLN